MSYTFSSAEQAQIQAAISASTGLSWDGNRYLGVPGAGTNAVLLYQTLSSLIAQKLATPISFDQVTLKELQNAKLWLDVAVGANGATGMHSAFIRAFTNVQGRLRLGRDFTADEMQAASNAVAANVANGLLFGDFAGGLAVWTVPRGIGVRSCLLLPAITELNRSLPITPAPRLGCKAPLSRRDQPADAQYRQASQMGYGDAAPPVGPIEACRLAKGKT